MTAGIRTYRTDVTIPVESVAADVSLNVAAAAGGSELFRIETKSSKYLLNPESGATIPLEFAGRVETVSVPVLRGKPLRVSTRRVPVERAKDVRTVKVVTKPPGAGKSRSIDCRPPADVKVFKNTYMDRMPIRRHMLDLKYVPYPAITDFVILLAEKNGIKYTNVQLIGVFDPVPVHLAAGLVLDPVNGVLKYSIRGKPVETEGRKIARVIYGRNRATDEIISAVAPVT